MPFNWDAFVDKMTHPFKIPGVIGGARAINVQSFTPFQGPWTGSNNLGWAFDFEVVGTTHKDGLLKLPEWGPPEIWTVALGIEYPNANWVISGGFEVLAHISAGAGGATQEFDVDWNNGVLFSMPMNALSIEACSNSALVAPTRVRLTATLSRGARAGNLPPTRGFRNSAVLPGGDSGLIIIPEFARRLELVAYSDSTNLYNPASYVEFKAKPTGGTSVGRLPTAMLLSQPDIIVPHYARSCIFHNGSAVGLDFSWNFKLGL